MAKSIWWLLDKGANYEKLENTTKHGTKTDLLRLGKGDWGNKANGVEHFARQGDTDT